MIEKSVDKEWMRMVLKQDHCYDKFSVKQEQHEENLLTTCIHC